MAGLSTDGQYLHVVETVRISATRLLTKGFSLFSLNIHDKTIWLSDHRKTSVVISSDVWTNKQSRAATTAAINSSLGKECFFSGAALDLDITSVQLVPCCRYTTAPYAWRLASAKICKVNPDVDGEEVHRLGNGSVAACTISLEIWFHALFNSSLRVVSQFICCCQSFWRSRFAEIVTGVISPKGSKIVEAHFSMSRLVVAVVTGETIGLWDE